MRKKNLMALSFAAIAIVSGYAGIKANRSQACGGNDLLAQNIEALTQDESYEYGYYWLHTNCLNSLGDRTDKCKGTSWIGNVDNHGPHNTDHSHICEKCCNN